MLNLVFIAADHLVVGNLFSSSLMKWSRSRNDLLMFCWYLFEIFGILLRDIWNIWEIYFPVLWWSGQEVEMGSWCLDVVAANWASSPVSESEKIDRKQENYNIYKIIKRKKKTQLWNQPAWAKHFGIRVGKKEGNRKNLLFQNHKMEEKTQFRKL